MKIFLHKTGYAPVLLLIALCMQLTAEGQATRSYPFAIGRNSACGTSGSHELHYYTYNSTTNTIANATGGTVGPCVPQLRIGGALNGTQRFTSSYASVSYNPADRNIYYLWTALPGGPDGLIPAGGSARTYAWRWQVGTCAGTAAVKLDTVRSFPADILGVAFDNSGNGYMIDFTGQMPTTPPTYKPLIRSISFTTGVMGVADTLALTGGANIYQTGSGDLAISPSGQMFFVLDNKLFTPNYKNYTGTGQNLTCTFVDTVINSATGYFVGLTYADGQTVSAYSGGGCPFYEINQLTAATNLTTKSGTVYGASDMASVISGIGVSKKLFSLIPTGTANQYDVEYDVYVQNYGNHPLTSVQVTDDLRNINTAANVVIISKTIIANPAGVTINAGYDGEVATNLLAAGQTLSNLPGANSFTIRIKCRLSNIIGGQVYNNSATASAVGFNSIALSDVSTNGTSPDLDGNDKPDDAGENQPTPLLIAITPQTPPCATLGQVFYTEDFGTGSNASALPTPGGSTTYTGSLTQPLAVDRYMLAANANAGDNSKFISLTDHTTGTGRMMIVNADATNKVFYSGTLGSLCAGQQYSLSFYAAFLGNASYRTVCDGFGGFKYPKVKMKIRDAVSNLVITEISTSDITATAWNLYGMKWVMPAGYSNIVFELINDGQGGCGNDLALDDIRFGTCEAGPVVTVTAASAGCMSSPASMSAALNDPAAVPGTKEYQWQVSTDNSTWTDIGGATAITYNIASVSATDVGKYYRVLVAAAGNMASSSCRYTSPGYLLSAKSVSAAPTSAVRNRAGSCPGEATSLRVSGGTLGTGAVYRWYSGSCGGTLVGTGATISVSPTVTTTYYVRIEGDCNTTACIPVTVTVACDLDADDDGVPDALEALNVDPKTDDDFDGVPNWRDADYAGFVDTNGDGVNDNFDLDKDGVPNFMDRDSDNDGIPDVVEAGGGDADGNGVIDGYSDSDADGFSDNVDANLTSHLTSGNGLGALDLDGDGVPNYLDLDSDNDGVPDVLEVYGADSNNNGAIDGFADTDGDGLSNSIDGDADGNGTIENVAGPLLKTGTVLSNGRAGSYPNKNMDGDTRANPYDLDSDGDGIADVIEAQLADLNYDGRIDGTINARGWSTTVSSMVTLVLLNSDATGRSNVYDIDSDDDGIPDNVEGMSTSAYLLSSGADADGDGIDNIYDNISGWGGKGITPFNKDGDALPDYLDLDTDGDGVSDRIEGNDFNFNGKPDDDVALTGLDTDGDGLDNKFDSDNSSARGTSQYMGNGGSFAGPSSAGSRATVQKTLAVFTDRDWRQVEYILDLEFLSFNARLKGEQVVLSWEVLSYAGVGEYVVEESTDGVLWTVSGRVPGTGGTGNTVSAQKLRYSYELPWKGGAKTHYRIKAQQTNNKTIRSNIQSLKEEKPADQSIVVVVNPVHTSVQLGIRVTAAGLVQLQVFDAKGMTVLSHRQVVSKGYNKVQLPERAPLQNGHYYIKAQVGNEVLGTTFLLQR